MDPTEHGTEKPRVGHGLTARRILLGLVAVLGLLILAFLADLRTDGELLGLTTWEDVRFECEFSDFGAGPGAGWEETRIAWGAWGDDELRRLGTEHPPHPLQWKVAHPDQQIGSGVTRRRRFKRLLALDFPKPEQAREIDTGDRKARWYATGTMDWSREYRDGVPHGEWIDNYLDGRPKEILHYKNGQRNGKLERWWPKGREKEKATFVNGQIHGE